MTQPPGTPDSDIDLGPAPTAHGLQTAGQIRDTVLAALAAGSVDEAASQIACSGAAVGDALLEVTGLAGPQREALAEAFFRARDFDRAAVAAQRVDDRAMAARLLEQGGQYGRAAALRESLGQRAEAADLHQRAGDHARAAQLFVHLGQLDRAAESLEQAGDAYGAGRLWARLRQLDRAIDVLQQVDSAGASFVPAVHLLGRILEFTGHPEAAAARYLEVVHARPLDATTVDIHERLLTLYVQANESAEARRMISRILRFEPQRAYPIRALGLLLGKGSTEATMRSAVTGESVPGPLSALPTSSGPARTVTAVHPVIDRLRRVPLLADLSLGELRRLHVAGSVLAFEPGQVLIEQGTPEPPVLVLLAGAVQVARVDDDGRETPLAELRYGAFVGEMSLLDEGPASARVRASAAGQAFRWPAERLRRLLHEDERTALRLLRVMSRALSVRLRETSRQVR
ncbi:MAG: cyclic nucleotide-binding domain-containing protein [Myxococcales bacterium]|nr:MAG: cyclic nucleotide-binding domain-containing protein [Myxococcales bacterium]